MTIGYDTLGTGAQKVLVLHDWMSTATSYEGIRPFLDTDRFGYAFMDHRGYGRSRAEVGTNTAREAAGDVLALADRLGWGRFDLVAHSMSAMVAQRALLDAPDRIRSLAAITPVGAGGVPLDADGVALFTSAATSDVAWQIVAKMVTSDRLPQRWYDSKLRQFRESVDPKAFLRFLDMWTKTDFSAEMVKLKTPALVLVGRHDFMAFSEQIMKQTFGRWFSPCEITVLEGAGHYPMAETPLQLVSALEAHLRRQD